MHVFKRKKIRRCSAYRLQVATTEATGYKIFWKAWAPGQAKLFTWLLHQNRLWCNDRLQRNLGSSLHLLWNHGFATAIRNQAASWKGCEALRRQEGVEIKETTAVIRAIVRSTDTSAGRGIRSMVILISWEIWHERNNCTFRGKLPAQSDVNGAIRRNVEKWRLAAAKCMESTFGDSLFLSFFEGQLLFLSISFSTIH